jgi:hypothetical protein
LLASATGVSAVIWCVAAPLARRRRADYELGVLGAIAAAPVLMTMNCASAMRVAARGSQTLRPAPEARPGVRRT